MTARSGLVAAALLLCACGGDGGPPAPVSDSVYVEVMARLVVLDTALSPRSDPSELGGDLDSIRGRILDHWGVTADQLLEYAETRGTRPEHMRAIWSRIDQLTDTLRSRRWTPPGARPDSGAAGPDSALGATSLRGGSP